MFSCNYFHLFQIKENLKFVYFSLLTSCKGLVHTHYIKENLKFVYFSLQTSYKGLVHAHHIKENLEFVYHQFANILIMFVHSHGAFHINFVIFLWPLAPNIYKSSTVNLNIQEYF